MMLGSCANVQTKQRRMPMDAHSKLDYEQRWIAPQINATGIIRNDVCTWCLMQLKQEVVGVAAAARELDSGRLQIGRETPPDEPCYPPSSGHTPVNPFSNRAAYLAARAVGP